MNTHDKLHPRRFPNMSPKMAAILGCILGEKYTEPAIEALCVTSDGCLLAQHEGDIGFNDFMGTSRDLERNWRNLLDAAELTEAEREAADALYRQHVRRV